MPTTIQTSINDLIAAIAAALKSDRAKIADLEIAVESAAGGGLTQQQVESIVMSALADLVDGAPETLDTLKELADELQTHDSAVSGLLTAVANRLSYADPQVLNPTQLSTAQTNIGLGDWAGAEKTLVEIFEDALADEEEEPEE